MSPSIVSGRVVEKAIVSFEPTTGYVNVQKCPSTSSWNTSSSATAVCRIRVPVDEPLAAVDQAVGEQLEERAADGERADVVEREPRPPPVAACPILLELVEDPLFVGVLPFPDAVDERLAADVVPRQPLFFEHPPFDDRLRGDAGVVGARHPQGFDIPASAASG